MNWTQTQMQQLKDLWNKGFTASEISQRIDRSRNAVLGKVHRMGLKPRQSPIVKKPKKSVLKPVQEVYEKTVGKYHNIISVPSGACLWQFGDIKNGDATYCGDDVVKGKSYCACHYKKVYRESSWKDMYKEPWQRKDV